MKLVVIEDAKKNSHSRVLKQTAFLCVITTRKEPGWMDQMFENWFHKHFVPEV
jgi:hypothetical protein